MTDSLLRERHDHVSLLTINRPQVRNALNAEVVDVLRAAILECETDGTHCIVITGAEGAFSSGADLKQGLGSADDAYRMLTEHYAPCLKAIRSSPLPVIAAVDGYAAGIAFDMACACDLRLASSRARFAELFIRIGLIPDGGGTYLLPRIIGLGRAMEMMMTGVDVTAEEALQIGLANRVFPLETFREDVLTYANRISQQSPQALRRGKALMQAALDTDYAAALQHEAEAQRAILSSEDGLEGIMAFVQKRAPVWSSR
jgi:2-(1,2-epoxy-1,2-dihydrophenyl)acetyl-CoA isomerase